MSNYDIKIQQSLGTTKMNTRFTTRKCDFYANSIYHKIYVMKYMLLFFISICSYSIGKRPFLYSFIEITKTRWWMGMGTLCIASQRKSGIIANSRNCLHKPSFEVSAYSFSIQELCISINLEYNYFLQLLFILSRVCHIWSYILVTLVLRSLKI